MSKCVCDPMGLEWRIEGRPAVCGRYKSGGGRFPICLTCEHDEECHAPHSALDIEELFITDPEIHDHE